MTNDRSLETLPANETSKAFNAVAPSNPDEAKTPEAIMLTFGQMLFSTSRAIPWEQAKVVMQGLLRGSPLVQTILEDRMHRFVNGKSELDQNGVIQFIKENPDGNPQPQTPDPLLVKKASAMLTQLGVADDQNHSLATGIAAKSASAAAALKQQPEPEPANKEPVNRREGNNPSP